MPELAEVHRYSQLINEWGANRLVLSLITCDQKIFPQAPELIPSGVTFKVSSSTRGKEQLLMIERAGAPTLQLLFNHGLEGTWRVVSGAAARAHPGVRLILTADDQSALVFLDKIRMARVTPHGCFNLRRSPDPIDEAAAFKAKLASAKIKANLTIGEMMLDQDYFNGIGNYLRSEILHRAGINPMALAQKILVAPDLREKIADLCREVPLEVLSNPLLNKYGTPEEQAAFTDWLQVYQKAPAVVDSRGRKMFSFSFGGAPAKAAAAPKVPAVKTAKPDHTAAAASSSRPPVAAKKSKPLGKPLALPSGTPYPPLSTLQAATDAVVIDSVSNYPFNHIGVAPNHALVSADEHRYLCQSAGGMPGDDRGLLSGAAVTAVPAFPSASHHTAAAAAAAAAGPISSPSLKATLLFIIGQAFKLQLLSSDCHQQLKQLVLTSHTSAFLTGVAEAFLAEPEYTDWKDVAESLTLSLVPMK